MSTVVNRTDLFQTHDSKRHWVDQDGAAATGSAFLDSVRMDEQGLASYALSAAQGGRDAFVAAIKRLNGFFAIVLHPNPHETWLAVDACRSIPLFFVREKPASPGAPLVAHDPRTLAASFQPTSVPPIARAEYIMGKMVTGSDTFDPRIAQVRAGEVVFLTHDEADAVRFEHRVYQQFAPSERLTDDQDALVDQVHRNLAGAIERLTRFAGGRSIVLPLSGGYDSRVLLCLLKESGYPALQTFTYGKPGNLEATISESVAKKLGVPWAFVPYSHDGWRAWGNSARGREYLAWAHGMVSVSHIQDFMAVESLRQQGTIRQDAVLVPGLSGDFLGGSLISPTLLSRIPTHGPSAVSSWALERNFKEWPVRDFPAGTIEAIAARIEGSLDHQGSGLAWWAREYERWCFNEHLAKFVINSVRGYEFQGLDWWLPFYDAEVLRFWESVPFEQRVGKKLYDRFAVELYARVAGVEPETAKVTEKSRFGIRLRKWVRGFPSLFPLARKAFDQVKKRRMYNDHPLAWFGLIDPRDFRRVYTGRQSINGLVADRLMREWEAGQGAQQKSGTRSDSA